MLELRQIDAGYGRVQVLHGLSLEARPGEILCLLGRNGAGKTTTLRAIMGQVTLSAGGVWLDGCEISRLPAHEIPRQGIGYVPQGRRLFAELTVAENLEIGLMARASPPAARDEALGLFPVLGERLGQRAGTLSGGEQQMLAIARALCLRPTVLLLDEPTEGLQPSMIALIRDVVTRLRGRGVAILMVEQRVDAVLSIADRVAFVENGRVRETVAAGTLAGNHDLVHRYVGVSTGPG